MTTTLLARYIQTGMIQFGRFKQPDGSYSPLSINFLLLPSFPALLQETAHALVPLLAQTSADRLLALRSTVALGAVLAVESGLPLTYQHGEMRNITNAYIIEGAYDIGHPTTLITDFVGFDSDVLNILTPAQQVGLEVQDVVCICRLGERGTEGLQQQGIRLHALFDLAEALPALQAQGLLPAPMVRTVQQWLEGES